MTQFSDLNLPANVLQAITEAGYTIPTPIQSGAIPSALEGRDILGIAQTGTGKTASFTLPLITRLGKGRARARMPRSLVLAPTRELAAQVAENFNTYAKYTKLTKALLIGGVSFGEQDKLIDRGVDVLIATPGRLLDHVERGKLLLTGVQIMVVDEADRMLDMGFIPDIERIFSLTPFTRQTFFYSATMAPEIERITNTFLSNPVRVEVARQATTSETIEQGLIRFRPSRKDRAVAFREKRQILRALIAAEGEACTNAIIFCNRKMDVDVLAKSLKEHGLDAAAIHGDLDQSQRTRTLDGFREGTLRFLVASDVAARGLDIPAVSHVFNFDVPSHPEDYVHRIGRTGRAGRKGKAFTLAALPADEKYLVNVEALIKQPIPPVDSPVTIVPAAGEEEGTEERTARSRSRSRERSRDEKPSEPRRAELRSEARAEPRTAPATEPRTEPRTERREAPQEEVPSEGAGAGLPPARGERPGREERAPRPERPLREGRAEPRAARDDGPAPRRERRPRGGERDDAAVVGMGDHVPDFILRSFAPNLPSEQS